VLCFLFFYIHDVIVLWEDRWQGYMFVKKELVAFNTYLNIEVINHESGYDN
jgi:hypothetical protein